MCNHAGVLSQGQMIFRGSLQDLKGRIRKNHYELDLDGEQKAITKAMQVAARAEGLHAGACCGTGGST